MGDLFKFATSVGEGEGGVVVLLIVVSGLALWAYWQERKENRRIQADRLAEAREDTELMTNALNEASGAVHEFKNSNDALRIAFETFMRTR